MAKSIEASIREYLEALGQGTKPIVDKEAVKALKADIKAEADPINKLKLMGELATAEEGEAPDLSGPQAVFVAEAKKWAEANSVPASGFVALGVPEDVLKSAGFAASDVKAAPKASSGGARAPRLDPETEVLPVAAKLKQPFKATDLADAIERNPATTNNYLKALVEAGKVAEDGVDETSTSPRKPKLYKVA